MNPTESTTNIIVALINADRLATVEQVAEAYKTIYNTVVNPNN